MPSNIMHAIHDDILPLLHTLREIGLDTQEHEKTGEEPVVESRESAPHGPARGDPHHPVSSRSDAVLVFLDRHGRVDATREHLYDSVRPSRHLPVLYGTDLSDIPDDEPVCFLSAHLGVSKATTWYDYGFHQPQGPLNSSGTASATAVRAAAHRLARRLGVPTSEFT